jgi:ring-1,2-phenylacetyl-CoA epoxidase subunit PaaD
MLTLADLGILRAVSIEHDTVVATITPTYSGCPAMREIAEDLHRRLGRAGYHDVSVRTQLAPPWTSDWITDEGRRKLAEAGIAPPHPKPPHAGPVPLTLHPTRSLSCPRCGSMRTSVTATFGATACRSLHRCDDCREPFEHVKEI